MTDAVKRRKFIKSMIAFPAVTAGSLWYNQAPFQPPLTNKVEIPKLKISLNAYSFNEPLRNGSMNLEDLLDFCAATGFDAVDLTGYYFPGYPKVPPDEYIFKIKRKAVRLGLDINGTGVKNDFTDPDENKRRSDIILIKNWIELAAKLGAPVIRIFTGAGNPQGFTRQQVLTWMAKDISECVDHGKKYGVIVAIQNHNDFIKTAEEASAILKMAESEWLGLVLDIGSYRTGDPYKQIAETAAYAVNWQIKENMYVNGIEQKTDLRKVIGIIKLSGYRGYLPIETLGSGDPKVKVPLFLEEVRKAVGA